MKKRKSIQINLSNKMFYTLIIAGAIILLGVVVYAYGGFNPSTMGHSLGEIETCADGQVLQANAGVWECADLAPIVGDTNAETICNPGEYLDGDGNCVTEADIVPQGTLCGLTTGSSIRSLCIGHNPRISCPSGYTQFSISDSGPSGTNDYFCSKD